MAFTRRRLLGRAVAAAGTMGMLQAAGIYGLIDGLAMLPKRLDASGSPAHPEQHLIDGIQTITDNNVQVLVPPLYHQVVTARLRVPSGSSGIKGLQRALEESLQGLDARYPNTPGGLNVVVAWGLPYFTRYVPGPWADHAPVDHRATATAGHETYALIEAIRFPSDPAGTILEQNDLSVLFASDSLSNIADGAQAIFGAHGDALQVTSIRKGFVGGGFGGGQSLPKQMALAANIPGAASIPDNAELFLGFTSTQKAALGPGQIANLESLPGLTDQWPNGYFCYGTTMHLSHLFEDLEAWYSRDAKGSYANRVQRTFKPEVSVPYGTVTVPEDAGQIEDLAAVKHDATAYGLVGHSATLQPLSRLPAAVTDNHGTTYSAGTPIPQRADFDTLDNPFFDRANGYAAGLHFVVFAPTSDAFHRTRMAMDGVYPDGTNLANAPYKIGPHSAGMGFNSVLSTTHRQNYLVPPRVHRSFPMAELL